jgi:hypothetical protein
MAQSNSGWRMNRRQFLGTSGAATASAVMPSVSFADAKKSLPIGVFTPVYRHLPLDEMLDKISTLGLEAVEIVRVGTQQLLSVLLTNW